MPIERASVKSVFCGPFSTCHDSTKPTNGFKKLAKMQQGVKDSFFCLEFESLEVQHASKGHCKMARHSKKARCTCIIFAVFGRLLLFMLKHISAEAFFSGLGMGNGASPQGH